MLTYKTTIKLHDTDAAGLLFFANQFKIVHEAYEILFEQIGFGFAKLIRDCDFFLPIVHAQSDYTAPLFVGDKVKVEVRLAKIGRTSFTLSYRLFNQNNKLVGTSQTVHVSVAKTTKKKIPLPPALLRVLKKVSSDRGRVW